MGDLDGLKCVYALKLANEKAASAHRVIKLVCTAEV
jgi:hypothetical protein